MKKNSGHKLEL